MSNTIEVDFNPTTGIITIKNAYCEKNIIPEINIRLNDLDPNLLNEQLQMRAADIYKDAYNTTYAIKDGAKFNQLLKSMNYPDNLRSNFTSYFSGIYKDSLKRNGNFVNIETYFAHSSHRFKKMNCETLISESGRDPRDWCYTDPGSINYIAYLSTCADPAPRKTYTEVWPEKENYSLVFTGNYLKNLLKLPEGVNMWKSVSLGKKERPFDYEFDIFGLEKGCATRNDILKNYPTCDESRSYDFSNANKNMYIDSNSINDESKKRIILKEMGDIMQVQTFFVWYNIQKACGINMNDVYLYTTDKVVFILCEYFKVPCVYTGEPVGEKDENGKHISGNFKIITYKPNEIPVADKVRDILNTQIEDIIKHNLSMKYILVSAKISGIQYWDVAGRRPAYKSLNCPKKIINENIERLTSQIDNNNDELNRIKNQQIQPGELYTDTEINHEKLENYINELKQKYKSEQYLVKITEVTISDTKVNRYVVESSNLNIFCSNAQRGGWKTMRTRDRYDRQKMLYKTPKINISILPNTNTDTDTFNINIDNVSLNYNSIYLIYLIIRVLESNNINFDNEDIKIQFVYYIYTLFMNKYIQKQKNFVDEQNNISVINELYNFINTMFGNSNKTDLNMITDQLDKELYIEDKFSKYQNYDNVNFFNTSNHYVNFFRINIANSILYEVPDSEYNNFEFVYSRLLENISRKEEQYEMYKNEEISSYQSPEFKSENLQQKFIDSRFKRSNIARTTRRQEDFERYRQPLFGLNNFGGKKMRKRNKTMKKRKNNSKKNKD